MVIILHSNQSSYFVMFCLDMSGEKLLYFPPILVGETWELNLRKS